MDWIETIQQTVDFIEEHLTEQIDSDLLAHQCHVSVYHFQRVFGVLSGYSVEEYVRKRRLSCAKEELQNSCASVLEIALKYQYESSESFSRAFRKFYGVNPSVARKNHLPLKSFERLMLQHRREKEEKMKYHIQTADTMYFLGYKRRFSGVPSDRDEQEKNFFIHTRLRQFALQGLVKDCETSYTLISGVSEEAYDFYIAARYNHSDCWLTEQRYQNIIKLNPEIGQMFEKIVLPAATYAVFETEPCDYPTEKQTQLRKEILTEWLPGSEFQLAQGTEVAMIRWLMGAEREKRVIQLWMPVEKR